jgi:hypothetical protein
MRFGLVGGATEASRPRDEYPYSGNLIASTVGARDAGPEDRTVAQDNTGRRRPRMLWLALACVLAVAVCGCLLVADLLGQVLALWQERLSSVRWLNVGAAGQAVLAAAAICVLVAGARRPGWRRGTVLAEVLIVVVAFGWFFLTAWLQRRALPRSGCRHRIPRSAPPAS